MKVDCTSFPESICTPESKSIHGWGGRHKLLLFWNPNVARRECNSVSFLSIVPKQQNRIDVSIV
jgi:hypothetical protein